MCKVLEISEERLAQHATDHGLDASVPPPSLGPGIEAPAGTHLSALGIAEPLRRPLSERTTAYSDLVLGMTPDLNATSGVLVAGYGQDYTTVSHNSSAVGHIRIDVEVGRAWVDLRESRHSHSVTSDVSMRQEIPLKGISSNISDRSTTFNATENARRLAHITNNHGSNATAGSGGESNATTGSGSGCVLPEHDLVLLS